MKTKLLIVFLLLFQKAYTQDFIVKYQIVSIQKTNINNNLTNKAYIITLLDTISNSKFTLISIKNIKLIHNRIKAGKYYDMNKVKYFNQDCMIQIGFSHLIELQGIKIKIPHNNYTSNIYTSPNIKGLQYIKPKY